MTFGSFLACVSYGVGINPAAVPLFRKRFSQSFPPTVFHRLFYRISHGLGIDPSSFLMRSLGADPSLKGSAPRSLIEYYCRDEERVIWASILLLFRCFGSVSPSHSLQRFSIGFSIVFRMVWASILLAF